MFWQGIGPGWRSGLYVPQPKVLEDFFDHLFIFCTTINTSSFNIIDDENVGFRTLHLPRPQKATALVPTFCGRDYGRDVVPLNQDAFNNFASSLTTPYLYHN